MIGTVLLEGLGLGVLMRCWNAPAAQGCSLL